MEYMTGKILFTDPTEPLLAEALTAAGFACDHDLDSPRAVILEKLSAYQGLVIRSRLKIDRELIDAAPDLQFIARSGVGVEHIDLAYAASRGITVFTSPEGSRDAVGEHTLGLLLMLMNNLARADRQVRQGQWIRGGNRGYEIKGKTVGILGYGNMGTAFAQRLQGFDCEVIAYDKFKENYGDENAQAVSLAELQARADILSIHIPYTPENHHFINGAFLDAFAHPVWVVNTARGLVLDTAALVERLANGQVRGAALDVIEYEDQSFVHLDPKAQPAPFQQLLEMPQVVLNPHIAGWSYEAEEGHARTLARKILAHYGLPEQV
jgi:D-3-phosphoglycerate dehydrogenase